VSLQVAVLADVVIAARGQKRGDRVGLVVAMLKNQPASGVQMSGAAVDDFTHGIQAIATGGQRWLRLVAEIALSEVWVFRRDVGRVADDQVEAVVRGQWFEPVTLQVADMADA